MSAEPKDTLPYSLLGWGLTAAFAHTVAPEWLELSLVGLALVLSALLGGALAVYLIVMKLFASERPEVRQLSWRRVTLVSLGAGLLVWVSATSGGEAGKAAALTAPALGLLGVGAAVWALRRRPRGPAV